MTPESRANATPVTDRPRPVADPSGSPDDAQRLAERELRENFKSLSGELSDAAAEAGALLSLQLERARIAAGDAVLRVSGGLVAFMTLAVMSSVASILLLLGIRDAIESATESASIGSLSAGLFGLVLTGLLLLVARHRFEQRNCRRLSQRHQAPTEPHHEQE